MGTNHTSMTQFTKLQASVGAYLISELLFELYGIYGRKLTLM